MSSAILTTSEAQPASKLKYLLWRYRFLLLAMVLFFTGLSLELSHERFAFAELARDLGITLLIAGTVGLGLELYTRRDFLELVSERLNETIDASKISTRLEDLVQVYSASNDLQAFGVRRIHRKRPHDLFFQLVDEAESGSEIKILGICLMSLNEARMRDSISTKLRQGCKFKLLMLNANSPAVEQRALDENRKFKEVKAEIEASEMLHRVFLQEGTVEEARSNMEIGYYDDYPNYFIFSTSQVMVVGFYLRGQRGEEFPHFELEVRGGGMCAPFLRHFDFAWERKKDFETPMLPFDKR